MKAACTLRHNLKSWVLDGNARRGLGGCVATSRAGVESLGLTVPAEIKSTPSCEMRPQMGPTQPSEDDVMHQTAPDTWRDTGLRGLPPPPPPAPPRGAIGTFPSLSCNAEKRRRWSLSCGSAFCRPLLAACCGQPSRRPAAKQEPATGANRRRRSSSVALGCSARFCCLVASARLCFPSCHSSSSSHSCSSRGKGHCREPDSQRPAAADAGGWRDGGARATAAGGCDAAH